MSPQAKKEYLKAVWLRYKKASSKAEKSQILDELCTNCHFNRKYVIRRLGNFKILRRKKLKHKPGPKPKYQHPEFLAVLKEIWITANLPYSNRLKAILPTALSPFVIQSLIRCFAARILLTRSQKFDGIHFFRNNVNGAQSHRLFLELRRHRTRKITTGTLFPGSRGIRFIKREPFFSGDHNIEKDQIGFLSPDHLQDMITPFDRDHLMPLF